MTIAPEAPQFVTEESHNGFRTLAKDHLTFVNVGLGFSLAVLIKAGYETDGSSVPDNLLEDKTYGKEVRKFLKKTFSGRDPSEVLRELIGTPWDMPRLLAAIVHDALYDRHWKCRWFCDMIYRRILTERGYDVARTGIEYSGIRLVGWRNWDSVSNLTKARAKRLVHVEVIRTKNRDKFIKKWS